MPIAATLSLYVGRVFLLNVLGALAALSGLFMLFDFIELLRRSTTKPDATFAIVSEIAALHLPWSTMQILPFAVLLGGILAFWRLTRSSELIVARAAGVSAWQFLTVPVALAVGLGIFATAAVSPISAVMRGRAEALDNTYLRVGAGPLTLNGGQLWVRQSDHGLAPGGVAILHAQNVTLHNGSLQARDVSVFREGGNDDFLERVEAKQALLTNGAWV
ncbi:MAG TPA: LptF/LptG family permease, partial [Acetobacteraceae bacterium]|nr:LptF/LptG family permease [Acetobacteraceae bacterium]